MDRCEASFHLLLLKIKTLMVAGQANYLILSEIPSVLHFCLVCRLDIQVFFSNSPIRERERERDE